MARPPTGPRLVERMEGSTEAKRRLEVILETVAGERSVVAACEELGISEARFHELRAEALEAALMRLEPGMAGRPRESEVQEKAEVAALKDEVTELRIELQAARIREEIAVAMPHLLKPKEEPFKKKKGAPAGRKRDT